MSRGYGVYRPGAIALRQKSAAVNDGRWRNSRGKLCWVCQKDKNTAGGSIEMIGGHVPGAVCKFVCADCLEAKRSKHAEDDINRQGGDAA